MLRLAGLMGDVKAARAKFVESTDLARKIGNRRLVYSNHSELAHILRAHGELDEALELYRDVLPKWKELGHRAAVAHELECLAFIAIARRQYERAARLLGAAETLRESIGSPMTLSERQEYDQAVSGLREQMEADAFAKEWAEGRTLEMEPAIAYALQM
jgi:non-specific serine/threonine protein kinase